MKLMKIFPALIGFTVATEDATDLSEAFCEGEIAAGILPNYSLKGRKAKMKRRGQGSYLYQLTVGRTDENQVHTGLLAYGVKHCGEDFVNKLCSGDVTIELVDTQVQYRMEGHGKGQID